LEKNKDQMPSASVDLLRGADFELLGQIQVRVVRGWWLVLFCSVF
jgi:hypothetical protein